MELCFWLLIGLYVGLAVREADSYSSLYVGYWQLEWSMQNGEFRMENVTWPGQRRSHPSLF